MFLCHPRVELRAYGALFVASIAVSVLVSAVPGTPAWKDVVLGIWVLSIWGFFAALWTRRALLSRR